MRFTYYKFLLGRLLLIFIIYHINRLLFYFINRIYFPDIDFGYYVSNIFLGSLKFDISAITYTNLLFIFLCTLPVPNFIKFSKYYRRIVSSIFVLCNIIPIFLDLSSTVYFPFSKNRLTTIVFDQISNQGNILQVLYHSVIQNWYLVILLLFYVIVLVKFSKIKIYRKNNNGSIIFYIKNTVLFCLSVGLVVLAARGGFVYKPINISYASFFVKKPSHIPLVINSPFSFMFTIGENMIPTAHFYKEEEVEKIYTPIVYPIKNEVLKKNRPYNVVIIILESFGVEYSRFYRFYLGEKISGYTPFLDQLYGKSKVYIQSFANALNSMNAMPSILASLPRIEAHITDAHYATNKITGLAHLLKQKGYQTSFFHAAKNGSMRFDAASKIIGYDNYFGLDEYDGNRDDHDGSWGIWDHKFFPYFSRKLSSFKEPFFATIFSLSSHHPFQLPDEFKRKYSGGKLDIHKMVEYTDNTLKDFFESIKKESWYDNTLFVITADHTNQVLDKQYGNSLGRFRVPIAFFTPDGSIEHEVVLDKNAQQIDILPTVIGYLGYDQPYVSFGFDLNQKDDREKFCFNIMGKTYQIIRDSLLLQYDIGNEKVTGVYNFKKDKFLKENLKNKLKGRTEYQLMVSKLKAFTQQYYNRMNRGKMFLDGK